MFLYLYKCRLLCLFRQKSIFLFSLGLPILLALLFFMGLNNLSEKDNNTIKLGILGNETEMTDYLKKAIKDDGTSVFYLTFTDEWEGEELLKQGDIKGLIRTGEKSVLYVLENGYEQSVINYYVTKYSWLKNIEKEAVSNESSEDIASNTNKAVVNRVSSVLPDREQIYFYNLIVLILLLGARLGFNEVKVILQERSPLGLRIMAAPKSRSGICFSNLAAAFTLHLVGVSLCLTFIIKVLKIDLLINILPLIIISFITSVFGFSIGIFICIIIKANNKVKSTVLNLLFVLGSVSAGLFNGSIKYFMLEKAPVFRYINPFILVFDTIYDIVRYDRFYSINFNFLLLSVITLLLTAYSVLFISRRDYAGI